MDYLRRTKGFEGWYFKHQKGEDVIAFIPGVAKSGAFIQVISQSGSRQFDVPELSVERGVIRAGNCLFSKQGCQIDLPGIYGEIRYGPLTPLRSDIMGPFQYLPMQCRHGVISMAHTLAGDISMDNHLHSFDGGRGYLETDKGTSFPRSYQWLQCNDFPATCSLMVSIAHIPLCGTSFTGCICAIIHEGQEYRLATYRGVQIRASRENYIKLSQGKLLLEIEIKPAHSGHPLRSPIQGRMSGIIRESSNACIRARLWNQKEPIFDLQSHHAMYEFVPEQA